MRGNPDRIGHDGNRDQGSHGFGCRCYLKAEPVPGSVQNLSVNGTCAPVDMAEIQREYPGVGSAGSPGGQQLGDPDTEPFAQNGIATPEGLFPSGSPGGRVGDASKAVAVTAGQGPLSSVVEVARRGVS